MKTIYFLLMTLFSISCSTSTNFNGNQDVGSQNVKNYYAYTFKENPSKAIFYLPEKHEIISKSNFGNELNQHYICITNSDLDEIQISGRAFKFKNKIYSERKLASIFWLELSWLENANSIFKESNFEVKNTVIYNVFKNNNQHTILLGVKEDKKIYIELINPSTTYDEELIKVKDIFIKIR